MTRRVVAASLAAWHGPLDYCLENMSSLVDLPGVVRAARSRRVVSWGGAAR
ncbi:hypothetical protein FHR81_002149 [Actinoalloteichus hoggarensis]|uniref:hypothetical protein n=1 Tax=Actinoalloteichus hoggarensis TaxID=1470176 RepID=UPI0012FD6A8F|nr:hypothetical protein [Actinoalloteichus hoggarensis]MBB5921111.1 hypothetical protein [Actinoalloteichus hoggarensis]